MKNLEEAKQTLEKIQMDCSKKAYWKFVDTELPKISDEYLVACLNTECEPMYVYVTTAFFSDDEFDDDPENIIAWAEKPHAPSIEELKMHGLGDLLLNAINIVVD